MVPLVSLALVHHAPLAYVAARLVLLHAARWVRLGPLWKALPPPRLTAAQVLGRLEQLRQ